MEKIKWSAIKSLQLKVKYGISFEDIIHYPEINFIKHPQRDNQFIVLYDVNGYIWAAPCVENKDGLFLKTLYPTRKYTKKFKQGEKI